MPVEISYILNHYPTDDDTIVTAVEKVRRQALTLGFLVSDLAHVVDPLEIIPHEYGGRFLLGERITPVPPELAICFKAAVPDSDRLEFGLARYPPKTKWMMCLDADCWSWKGTIKTEKARLVCSLFQFAADAGIDAFLRCNGTSVGYFRDEDGLAKIEVDFDP